jgi:hypothetical protein
VKTLLLAVMVLCAAPSWALTVADLAPPARPMDAAEIQAAFPQSILSNFEDPANAVEAVNHLPDYMLYQLYEFFAVTATPAQWEQLDAELISAGGVALWCSFYDKVSAASVAGAASKAAERAKAWPNPNIYMTLEEIYLEFATATSINISLTQAAAYTAIYAGGWLNAAFWGGYGAGTAFNNLAQEYDPDFDVTFWFNFQTALQLFGMPYTAGDALTLENILYGDILIYPN